MSWENNYLNFKNDFESSDAKAAEQRLKSFNSFMSKGLPTKKDEAWKFTSLSDFREIEWKLHDENENTLTHEQMQQISKHLPSEFINFVFVNGKLNSTLSDDKDGLFEILAVESSDFEFDEKNAENRILNLSQAFLAKKINFSVLKQKTIEKTVAGNELRITLHKLTTTKDQMLLLDLSVVATAEGIMLSPENFWSYQNKKSKLIESLFLGNTTASLKKNIQVGMAISKNILSVNQPIEISYRDKRSAVSLIIPAEVLWK